MVEKYHSGDWVVVVKFGCDTVSRNEFETLKNAV
jgi:hypothetical protein